MTREGAGLNVVAIETRPLEKVTSEALQLILDHGRLPEALLERDMQLVLTSKASFTAPEGGTWRRINTERSGSVTISEEVAAIEGIRAVYSRLVVPHPFIDDLGIPQLNPTKLKRYGKNKANMVGLIGDLEIPTQVVGAAELDQLVLEPGISKWVIKPVQGSSGRNVQQVTGGEVAKTLEGIFANPTASDRLVQPYVGKGELPEGVYGASASDHAAIDAARYHQLPIELRMFVIKNNDASTLIPILRIAGHGTDYLNRDGSYVDIEIEGTTAEILTSTTLEVTERLAQAADTGDKPFVMTVDFLYTNDQFWVMEANCRSPGLPVTSKHPHAAGILYPALIDTLSNMVAS